MPSSDTTQTYTFGVSTFRDRLTPDEWKAYRSAVNRKYHLSEKGQTAMRRANADPKAKKRYARYRQTEKYQAAQDRFKATGARSRQAADRHQRIKAERPDIHRAWVAVQLAVEGGRLVKPEGCEACGSSKHLVAHHLLGYEPEHQLDVQWLCRPCHKAAH